MRKQTNLRSVLSLSLAICAAITIIFGATFPSAAQDQPTFKVGDTVEVLSGGTWSKAEIHEARDGSYRIRPAGRTTYHYDEWVKPDRMRSVGGTAPANKQTNTTTANQTSGDYKVGDRVELNKELV